MLVGGALFGALFVMLLSHYSKLIISLRVHSVRHRADQLCCVIDRLIDVYLVKPTLVSQLVRYARACYNYENFVDRGKLLTSKLLSQGYRRAKLGSTLKKFYGRHHDLVHPYSVAASKLVSDLMPIANK